MNSKFSVLLKTVQITVLFVAGIFHFLLFEFSFESLMRLVGMEYSLVIKKEVNIVRVEKILGLNDIHLSLRDSAHIDGRGFLFGHPMRETLCVKIPMKDILSFSLPRTQSFREQVILQDDWSDIAHIFKTDDAKMLSTFLYAMVWTDDIDAFSTHEDRVVLSNPNSSGSIYFFLHQRSIEKIIRCI